jgi:hypothetical protein
MPEILIATAVPGEGRHTASDGGVRVKPERAIVCGAMKLLAAVGFVRRRSG